MYKQCIKTHYEYYALPFLNPQFSTSDSIIINSSQYTKISAAKNQIDVYRYNKQWEKIKKITNPYELVYINDFCPVNFSIADGGNDLFDGGNMMAFKHYGDTIYNNEILPYTHTQSSNGGEDSIDYTDPPMDGTVQSALAYYGGNNSEYFTNMYPGLFVFVATGVEADFFTVYGDMGSDGAEIVTTDDDNVQPNEGYNVSSGTVINHNGQTYTMYTRFSQDGDHSDPTLNHIMIIPGDGGWDHEYRASSNEDYYDEILLDSSAQEIYFLMFATTEDRVSNAEEIAKKFLEVIKNDFVVPHPSPAYTFEVQTYTMQELIGLGYYGDFLTDIIRQREEAVVHIINTPLKHGDQFTRYGAEALRFKKLFVDVENPILKIIGTAPVVENNDSYSVLEGSTKCFSAFAEAVTPGDSRITYSLGTEHDESYFSINSTTGRITANDPLSIDNYVLEIIAENAYGVGSKLVDLVVTNGSMLWVNEINSVEQIKQDIRSAVLRPKSVCERRSKVSSADVVSCSARRRKRSCAPAFTPFAIARRSAATFAVSGSSA